MKIVCPNIKFKIHINEYSAFEAEGACIKSHKDREKKKHQKKVSKGP